MKKLNVQHTIDVREIIERYEELTKLLDINAHEVMPGSFEELEELRAERALLEDVLAELRGNGGDEEWCGDWYPQTLIRDNHFKTYARELAEDCGLVDSSAQWPNTCIDWAQAARELQHDYLATDTGADADEQRKAFADLEGARADLTAWNKSPMGQLLNQLETAK